LIIEVVVRNYMERSCFGLSSFFSANKVLELGLVDSCISYSLLFG